MHYHICNLLFIIYVLSMYYFNIIYMLIPLPLPPPLVYPYIWRIYICKN